MAKQKRACVIMCQHCNSGHGHFRFADGTCSKEFVTKEEALEGIREATRLKKVDQSDIAHLLSTVRHAFPSKALIQPNEIPCPFLEDILQREEKLISGGKQRDTTPYIRRTWVTNN